MSEETSAAVEATVREIRRKTRKKYSAEEKVRIVLEGLRGEEKIAELCRREGIHQNMYYKRMFILAEPRRCSRNETRSRNKPCSKGVCRTYNRPQDNFTNRETTP